MTRMLLLLLSFCLSALTAQAVCAGAWPREKGSGFVSSDVRLSWPMELLSLEPTGKYYTLYAEYGLTDRLTLGMDLGRSVSGDGKSVVFLRLPLRRDAAKFKIALELGLGQIDGQTVVRPGLALGRSWSLWSLSGWLALDSLAEVQTETGKTDLKIDLTMGLNTDNGRKYIVQFQAGAPALFDPFLRVAPSVVMPFGKNRHIEIGGTYGLTGDASFGVKLGVWQTF